MTKLQLRGQAAHRTPADLAAAGEAVTRILIPGSSVQGLPPVPVLVHHDGMQIDLPSELPCLRLQKRIDSPATVDSEHDSSRVEPLHDLDHGRRREWLDFDHAAGPNQVVRASQSPSAPPVPTHAT